MLLFFLILTLFPFFKSDINFDFFLNLIIHFYFESCSLLLCVSYFYRIYMLYAFTQLFIQLFVCLFVVFID